MNGIGEASDLRHSMSRRDLLKLTGAAAGAVAVTAAPKRALAAPYVNRLQAPTGSLTYLQATPFLANTDPTMHTHLGMLWSEVHVYDRLMEVAPDKSLVPGLATEWTNVDPTTWEFKLRENVTFHDGAPFDAEDVKAAVERATGPQATSLLWVPAGQITVTIVDPLTVRMQTEKPAASVLYSLAMLPIPPQEYSADPSKFNAMQMGTGYFKFAEYDAATETVHYVANMDYWRGAPRIANYSWKYVPDSSTRLAALQAGEAHLIERPEAEQVAAIEGDPNLTAIRQLTIEQMWLGFKCGKDPFTDKLVRQAVAYALDRESIVRDIMSGLGRVADAHISPEAFLYASASNAISYDPEKAKSLLAEAGFPDGAGLEPLEYDIMTGFYPKNKEYGEYMMQNLRDVGIDAQLVSKEVGVLYNELVGSATPPWHMWTTGFWPPSPEPDIVLNALFKSPGSLTNYTSETLQAALDQEGQELDPAKRAQIMRDVTLPALMDEVPEFPLFTSMFTLGMSTKVQGLQVLATGQIFLNAVTVEA